MRIALISREYPPLLGGGIGTFAEAATRAFGAAGHEVRVVTQDRTSGDDVMESLGGVTVHRLGLPANGAAAVNRFVSFAVRAGRLLAGWHARGEVDVAEFADTEAASSAWVLARALGATRVPVVLGLHTCSELVSALGSLEPDLDATRLAIYLGERIAAAEADGLCSPSEFNARWFQRFYGLSEAPAVVRYPLAAPIRTPEPITQRRVLYVGRIEPRKGVETLLRAWPAAARRHRDWTLRLVGSDTRTAPGRGSLRAALERRLSEDVRGSVTFVGARSPAALPEEIASAALVVIPSRWDNFPNTCMEAMAGGRAVIVGDVGGTREMVGASAGGVVFRSGDAADLTRALTGLMAEPLPELEARGRVAQERIAALCDPARVTRERVEVYRRAIERAAGDRAVGRSARLAAWRLLREAGQRGHGVFDPVERPSVDPRASREPGAESTFRSVEVTT